MTPEWSARAKEFEAMVGEVVAMVKAAAANPDLSSQSAATLSRATENIVGAVQGLVTRLRLQGADPGFLAALEVMLGTLRRADLQAGELVIQASGILEVA